MRRRLALLIALLPLTAFSASTSLRAETQAQDAAAAIRAAVNNPERSSADKARDIYRHPVETLAFLGVKPTDTLVEFMPGGGWYTDILAPLVREHGRYFGAQPAGRAADRLRQKLADRPDLYGPARLIDWPVGDAIAPGSVDTVLTFRNVHNMVMRGTQDEMFAAFFTMLKPGGILGVVDHRLPEDADAARERSSGYVKTSHVRAWAEKAGFEFVSASEINANPKDSADWPKGVWTLPPTLTEGDVDRARYMAIGESDRMTLLFRKPAAR